MGLCAHPQSMPKILVCQHVPHEILGTLDPLLRTSGFRIRYANFGRAPDLKPDLSGYDGMVILGGPMNVDETDRHPYLLEEIRLIENALKNDKPVLGICLGSQLIAKALGAHVYRNHKKELGWYDLQPTALGREDALISHFQDREKVFQWHGCTFDIPKDAHHLVSSQDCPHQAFRYGDKTYGLQFHLEVDEAIITRWLNLPAPRQEWEELHGPLHSNQIPEITQHNRERIQELSRLVFGGFVGLFGERSKKMRLTSR
jgi:GMP synthase (glutamine-hydrolysing)